MGARRPVEEMDDDAVLAELQEYSRLEALGDPEEVQVEAESMRSDFGLFARGAWHVIEPVPLLWGRLQDAIAEHLQAVTLGQIQDLIINVRPRSSKSRLASVLWHAWEWARNPRTRWLTGSFDLSLARDHSRLTLTLLRSAWYRQRFGGVVIRRDLNAPSHFGNLAGGERVITSNRAGVTGKGGERLLWDDPHDAKKAGSKADLEAARVFWRAFSTRLNNKTDRRVVIGQRVAHADIFPVLQEEGNFVVLKLRTRFKPQHRCVTPIWQDPRTTEGEFLDPERFGDKEDAKARINLTAADYAAQHDQEPTPDGGQIFKLEDFRTWRYVEDQVASGDRLPKQDTLERPIAFIPKPGPGGRAWAGYFDNLLQSWDFAFKGAADSDFVVGQIWGRKGPRFYLLHQERARMEFDACLVAMKHMAALYPAVVTKLVEDKANGTAILNMLKSALLGLEEVDPGANGKPARAKAISPLVRAGNVYLPESHVRWGPQSSVAEYMQELQEFPRGTNDDQVDATSQALARLHDLYQQWLGAWASATGAAPPEDATAGVADLLAAFQNTL